jgi:hypothetical protein
MKEAFAVICLIWAVLFGTWAIGLLVAAKKPLVSIPYYKVDPGFQGLYDEPVIVSGLMFATCGKADIYRDA